MEEWEDLGDGVLEGDKRTVAEQERQHYDTNTAEDVIGLDHSNEPALLDTFAAFQTKLMALQEAASRVIAVEKRPAGKSESSVGTPEDTASVLSAGATAASKEQCRTLVLETQELAKKLTSPELKRMADRIAEHDEAVVSTSGRPLSMLSEETWAMCFIEFGLGDAAPNMKERGKKGNGTVYVPMEDIFERLQDLEELEYHLPSDTVPYEARARSRFDNPECAAVFGSALRQGLILRGVATVFRRQGYGQPLKPYPRHGPRIT